MSLNTAIVGLLLVNAVLHVIAFFELEHKRSNRRWGALAFAMINTLLAVFFTKSLSWARYLAIFFPLIGALGLTVELKASQNPRWLNFSMLLLDALIVSLVALQLYR